MDLNNDSLGITAEIPRCEEIDGVIIYTLTLTSTNNQSWTVHRRYSSFYTLDKLLRKAHPGIPKFPGKHRLNPSSKSAEFIAKRQQGLEIYMQWLLNNNQLRKLYEVKVFLELDNLESVKTKKSLRISVLGGRAFGADIQSFLRLGSDIELPYVVEQCCVYIFKHGLHTPNIFGKRAPAILVEDVKNRYNRGEDVDFSKMDNGVEVAAEVLYEFLNELQPHVISSELLAPATEIPSNDFVGRCLQLKQFCTELKPINYRTLRDVICLLGLIVDNQETTLMTEDKAVELFCPVLLTDFDQSRKEKFQEVVRLLLKYRKQIFVD